MQLTLDRLTYPWLQPKYFDMRLLDSNCRPFHGNVTHVIVKTKHEECNTVRTSSPGGVIYRNILMALLRPQPGRLVTRVPDVLFPFQCRFDPKKVASISSKNNLKMITPIGNEVVSMNTFEIVIRPLIKTSIRIGHLQVIIVTIIVASLRARRRIRSSVL